MLRCLTDLMNLYKYTSFCMRQLTSTYYFENPAMCILSLNRSLQISYFNHANFYFPAHALTCRAKLGFLWHCLVTYLNNFVRNTLQGEMQTFVEMGVLFCMLGEKTIVRHPGVLDCVVLSKSPCGGL